LEHEELEVEAEVKAAALDDDTVIKDSVDRVDVDACGAGEGKERTVR